MPTLRTWLISSAKPCIFVILALILSPGMNSVPAQAQDLFGFFRALSQPTTPSPSPQSFGYQPVPGVEQPRHRARPRPKPVAVEQPEVRKPVEPRPAGEIDNPVPELLADSTLRPGDMVMFPDGLRVFAGRSEGPHKLSDFKPVAQAGKLLTQETRKLVKHLLPSENIAWSTDAVRSSGKLAVNTGDVAATGSVSRLKARKDSRVR